MFKRVVKKVAETILIVLVEFFYSLSITVYVAEWLVKYAYSVRGYEAYGGEYILIIMVFGISLCSIHVFLKLLKKGGCN